MLIHNLCRASTATIRESKQGQIWKERMKIKVKRRRVQNAKKKSSYEDEVASYTSESEQEWASEDSSNDRKDKTFVTGSNKSILDDASSDDQMTDEERSASDGQQSAEEQKSSQLERSVQSKVFKIKHSDEMQSTPMFENNPDDFDDIEELREEDLSADESEQRLPKETRKQNMDVFGRDSEKRSQLSQEKEKARKKWNENMKRKLKKKGQ